jgi:poly(3-hydroxybutyrate) depolymerase
MKRAILLLGVLALAAAGLFISISKGAHVTGARAVSGVDHVSTNNQANRQLDFFYYIPSHFPGPRSAPRPLILYTPPLSSRGEDVVTQKVKNLAEETGPSLSPRLSCSTRTAGPLKPAISILKLGPIIDKVKVERGLAFSKFYLMGFSAGAQFGQRLAVRKPELCAACAAFTSGGEVLPGAPAPSSSSSASVPTTLRTGGITQPSSVSLPGNGGGRCQA